MIRLTTFLLVATTIISAQGPYAAPDPAAVQRLLQRHRPAASAAFEFAAIGDQQYGPAGERLWPNLLSSINRSGISFVVHTGDIKSGSTVCSNEMFADRLQQFNNFEMPMILTPGDNEWTDCHRANNGSYDSLERLRYLRSLFYSTNQSFGKRKLTLSQQSEDTRFLNYVENAMWSQGNVLFATIHVIGSNNNLARNAENDVEYEERTRANFNWIKTIFSVARDNDFAGVVLVTQANPGFSGVRVAPAALGEGFRSTFLWLEDEAIVYNRPILLIHGDTHELNINKPLAGTRSGLVIENLIRLEVPGQGDVHWVRVRVNPARAGLFSFEPEDVPENRGVQQRP